MTTDIFCTNGVIIGVKAPTINEIPSNETPAYKAAKNAFCGLTRKIKAMIPIMIGTMMAAPKLSINAFKNSRITTSHFLLL